MVANVISVLHLFFLQIEDHDTEAAGYIGEVAIKKDIVDFDDRYEVLFNKLKPRNYRYVDGNKGRVHSGFIAQEVTEAIEEAKMTLDEVAYVCAFENKEGETYYGLRYEELIAINTWQIQKLKERIKQLEDKLL